jgi:hypothetical protein
MRQNAQMEQEASGMLGPLAKNLNLKNRFSNSSKNSKTARMKIVKLRVGHSMELQ